MKKVVVILIVFALMIGGMAGEMAYSLKFYNEMQADLEVLAASIDESGDNVNTERNNELCARVANKWEKGKKVLLMLQNHNTIRTLDDKIMSLSAVIAADNPDDSVIFVHSAINYIDDILLDSIPYLSNIF